jgi:hypothetical protein
MRIAARHIAALAVVRLERKGRIKEEVIGQKLKC